MGGYGSGRWGSRKLTAEGLRRIDLAQVRHQYPITARSEMHTGYRRGNGEKIQATIRFTETATCFGGRRLWFICPSCGHRCRLLFAWRWLMCRRCCGLRYTSEAETRSDRATRAMFKIVRRLDPSAEFNDLPSKPKGMHWRTYERLADRYDEHDTRWTIEAMRRFGIGP
jgi:hypothetical protein